MTSATDMSSPVTRDELRAELAPLATKAELAPLATKAELQAAIAPLATKAELLAIKIAFEFWGGALLARLQRMEGFQQELQQGLQRMEGLEQRLAAELARCTQEIVEATSKQIAVIRRNVR
jgi:hypothetical protein